MHIASQHELQQSWKRLEKEATRWITYKKLLKRIETGAQLPTLLS